MTATNLSVAQAYMDYLWSRRNLYFLEILVAESCAVRDSLFGESTQRDHVKAQVCEMHQAFPDLAYTIDEIIADAGDQLALRWSARGTHRGSLIGIPATERAISISGVLLLRFAEDKLVAITSLWQPYTMLQQLGLVPGAYVVPAHVPPVEARAPVAPIEARTPIARVAIVKVRAPVVDIDAQWDTP